MAGLEIPVPDWRDGDAPDTQTPGGLLAGLPSPDTSGSLALLLDPKDIADIDSVPATVSEGATLGGPVALVSTQHDEIPIAPPGVSVDRNIQRAQDAVGDGWRMPPDPAAYAVMTELFSPDHEMDYKRGGHSEYRNFGNFNYGAVGSGLGITPYELHSAAGVVQMLQNRWEPSYGLPYLVPPFGDNEQDRKKIDAGIQYYEAHQKR